MSSGDTPLSAWDLKYSANRTNSTNSISNSINPNSAAADTNSNSNSALRSSFDVAEFTRRAQSEADRTARAAINKRFHSINNNISSNINNNNNNNSSFSTSSTALNSNSNAAADADTNSAEAKLLLRAWKKTELEAEEIKNRQIRERKFPGEEIFNTKLKINNSNSISQKINEKFNSSQSQSIQQNQIIPRRSTDPIFSLPISDRLPGVLNSTENSQIVRSLHNPALMKAVSLAKQFAQPKPYEMKDYSNGKSVEGNSAALLTNNDDGTDEAADGNNSDDDGDQQFIPEMLEESHSNKHNPNDDSASDSEPLYIEEFDPEPDEDDDNYHSRFHSNDRRPPILSVNIPNRTPKIYSSNPTRSRSPNLTPPSVSESASASAAANILLPSTSSSQSLISPKQFSSFNQNKLISPISTNRSTNSNSHTNRNSNSNDAGEHNDSHDHEHEFSDSGSISLSDSQIQPTATTTDYLTQQNKIFSPPRNRNQRPESTSASASASASQSQSRPQTNSQSNSTSQLQSTSNSRSNSQSHSRGAAESYSVNANANDLISTKESQVRELAQLERALEVKDKQWKSAIEKQQKKESEAKNAAELRRRQEETAKRRELILASKKSGKSIATKPTPVPENSMTAAINNNKESSSKESPIPTRGKSFSSSSTLPSSLMDELASEFISDRTNKLKRKIFKNWKKSAKTAQSNHSTNSAAAGDSSVDAAILLRADQFHQFQLQTHYFHYWLNQYRIISSKKLVLEANKNNNNIKNNHKNTIHSNSTTAVTTAIVTDERMNLLKADNYYESLMKLKLFHLWNSKLKELKEKQFFQLARANRAQKMANLLGGNNKSANPTTVKTMTSTPAAPVEEKRPNPLAIPDDSNYPLAPTHHPSTPHSARALKSALKSAIGIPTPKKQVTIKTPSESESEKESQSAPSAAAPAVAAGKMKTTENVKNNLKNSFISPYSYIPNVSTEPAKPKEIPQPTVAVAVPKFFLSPRSRAALSAAESAAAAQQIDRRTAERKQRRDQLAEQFQLKKSQAEAEKKRIAEEKKFEELNKLSELKSNELKKTIENENKWRIEQEIIKEKRNLSNMHHIRSLLYYYGWKPWRKYIEIQRMRYKEIENYSKFKFLRRIFYEWKLNSNQNKLNRMENELKLNNIAREFYENRMKLKYFHQWNQLIEINNQKLNKFIEFHRIHQLRIIFYEWNKKSNELIHNKELYYTNIGHRNILKSLFHQWKFNAIQSKIHKETEEKKKLTWNKVNNWLEEFRKEKASKSNYSLFDEDEKFKFRTSNIMMQSAASPSSTAALSASESNNDYQIGNQQKHGNEEFHPTSSISNSSQFNFDSNRPSKPSIIPYSPASARQSIESPLQYRPAVMSPMAGTRPFEVKSANQTVQSPIAVRSSNSLNSSSRQQPPPLIQSESPISRRSTTTKSSKSPSSSTHASKKSTSKKPQKSPKKSPKKSAEPFKNPKAWIKK